MEDLKTEVDLATINELDACLVPDQYDYDREISSYPEFEDLKRLIDYWVVGLPVTEKEAPDFLLENGVESISEEMKVTNINIIICMGEKYVIEKAEACINDALGVGLIGEDNYNNIIKKLGVISL